ncbi:DUF2202 domain-containing protein [Caldichromatium japonicum]|uniref:DUF2202 domain-containing protein n=1 Tax=Caldichromatium japonicum TaxID=2699430 RepID=A0A6G7V9A9_9GAMM|nr:DUF2202 domain-containing protein [Caldichromatium japonicum]QIK36653.1 DUF2202 domain-containing protein [Caldichromatium japonicum]
MNKLGTLTILAVAISLSTGASAAGPSGPLGMTGNQDQVSGRGLSTQLNGSGMESQLRRQTRDPSSHAAGQPTQQRNITYTPEQIATLLWMIEEEKLAGDLYEAFYDQTKLPVFDRIAAAEDRHMDRLVAHAQQANVDVAPILALPAGQFVNHELQALYDQLLQAGSLSAEAALAVGIQVEQDDIAALEAAIAEAAGTLLETVYSHLQAGSEHHLAAFDLWSKI